jgi:hypothetical protein
MSRREWDRRYNKSEKGRARGRRYYRRRSIYDEAFLIDEAARKRAAYWGEDYTRGVGLAEQSDQKKTFMAFGRKIVGCYLGEESTERETLA